MSLRTKEFQLTQDIASYSFKVSFVCNALLATTAQFMKVEAFWHHKGHLHIVLNLLRHNSQSQCNRFWPIVALDHQPYLLLSVPAPVKTLTEEQFQELDIQSRAMRVLIMTLKHNIASNFHKLHNHYQKCILNNKLRKMKRFS